MIRKLNLKDIPNVERLLYSMNEHFKIFGYNSCRVIISFKISLLLSKIISFFRKPINNFRYDFLYEREGEIIGFVRIENVSSIDRCWHIPLIVVQKKYRGQGIGSDLLRFVVSYLRDIKSKKIILKVNSKNKFAFWLYRNFGFRKDVTEYLMTLNKGSFRAENLRKTNLKNFFEKEEGNLIHNILVFLLTVLKIFILNEKKYKFILSKNNKNFIEKTITFCDNKIFTFVHEEEKNIFRHLGFKTVGKFYKMTLMLNRFDYLKKS